MSRTLAAVLSTGVVSSVGLSSEAICAALRAKLSNPSPTAFFDRGGKPIMAHQAPLERPWRGLDKLTRMAGMAAQEALLSVPANQVDRVPLLLCVAERERPGRLHRLDDTLFAELQRLLGRRFAASSMIVPMGRTSVARALLQARMLIEHNEAPFVLIVAVDSLLTAVTLGCHVQRNRLLTEDNSNGFMPGEGAGAVLVGPGRTDEKHFLCLGLGFGTEPVSVESEEPLRGEGMAAAVKAALADAGTPIDDIACRITDLSGEQYYFKEATLALSRTLRQRRDNLELWHPAESVGDVGAASGAICLAVAKSAFDKRYTPPGSAALLHFSDDGGSRAVIVAGPGG